MDARIPLRHLRPLRTAIAILATPSRPRTHTCALHLSHQRYLSIPAVFRPSFWSYLIPARFKSYSQTPQIRRTNPATPYIVLSLLVGSQAIQLLWLKQERARDLRKAEAKMGLLREVIERVRRGEDVDVEKMLGTGEEASEREWMEALRDIGEEEVLFRTKERKKPNRQAAEKEQGEAAEAMADARAAAAGAKEAQIKVESVDGAKFF